MFESPFGESIIRRAIDKKIIDLEIHNLRDWAIDDYGSVDDKPFGGDVGMLIRPEPVYKALKQILGANPSQTLPLTHHFGGQAGQGLETKTRIIMMSARGKKFDQAKAEELSKLDHLVLLAGHYEGFDQRISDYMVDEEISIGDYVLTGGELPAMVVMDSVVRLLPGVLGKDDSSKTESWSETEVDGKMVRTMEYPQYTRPRDFMGKKVPEVLVSGDPKKIKIWQLEQIKKTIK